MSTTSRFVPKTCESAVVDELQTGDHMTRQEFHCLYEQTDENFRAELIGGIVYVASPVRLSHGAFHAILVGLLFQYVTNTRGVQAADNATVLLGDESEPQPDLLLRILPEFGGQSRTTSDDYVSGAPELVIEVAHSTRAIDLHAKRDDYTRNGAIEYLVVSLRERRLRWFNLRERQELQSDTDGIVRAQTFPGLWIDATAFFAQDTPRLMTTLQQGLASPEHAEFLAKP
jgi:Uma2 family endonuclease